MNTTCKTVFPHGTCTYVQSKPPRKRGLFIGWDENVDVPQKVWAEAAPHWSGCRIYRAEGAIKYTQVPARCVLADTSANRKAYAKLIAVEKACAARKSRLNGKCAKLVKQAYGKIHYLFPRKE